MVTGLDNYIDKNIHAICGKYGDAPHTNNCAHFVGHALGYRLPGAALCSNCAGTTYIYAERNAGFCIRVDQVFNSLRNRSAWPENFPATQCICVATTKENITDKRDYKIGDNPTKHIGILDRGLIYNYSNTHKKVVKIPVAAFKIHYGPQTVLLKADLP
jgi:hypothetical protein